MKKLMLLIVLLLLSITVQGQKRNDSGLKMVKTATLIKEIKSFDKSINDSIVSKYVYELYFDYDNDDWLETMTCKYHKEKGSHKEKERITVYDRNIGKTINAGLYDLEVYTFNENGLITELQDIGVNNDGSTYGNSLKKNYVKDSKGIYRIIDTNSCYFNGDEVTLLGNSHFCQYKGIRIKTDYNEKELNKKLEMFDFTKPNDLNNNIINGILYDYNIENSSISITEWMGHNHDYLIKEGFYHNNQYFYDKKGNIVEVKWYPSKSSVYTLSIEYVY